MTRPAGPGQDRLVYPPGRDARAGPVESKAAEDLDAAGHLAVNVGGGQRLGLEHPGRRTELVLDRVDTAIQCGGLDVAPHRDLGQALVQCPQHALAYPLVAVGPVETFRSGAMSCPPIGADLVPAV